jgi:hypothetical protein
LATNYYALYTSLISLDSDPACVREIVHFARRNNSRLSITGLLIFDGLRFCQYLEGPSEHVFALSEKIRHDPRHRDMDVKEHGPLAGVRRFADWWMAYAFSTEADGLNELQKFNVATGGSAIAALERLLPNLDMEPT